MEKANGGTKYNSTSVSFWIITVALLCVGCSQVPLVVVSLALLLCGIQTGIR